VGTDTASYQHPVGRVKDTVAAQFLRQVWEEIEQRYSPHHVILFGSRATGRARADSDVDLILVSPCFEGQRLAERTRDFLLTIRPFEYGIAVDVLCYTPEEFEVMGTGIGMVAEAAKEGIWLR
jgi:predicted nucleotidyltransferase